MKCVERGGHMHNVTQGLIIALTTIACSGGNKYISESDFEGYEYVDTGDTSEDTEDTDTQDTDTQDTRYRTANGICQGTIRKSKRDKPK